MKKDVIERGYEALANAVIVQAVQDYKLALKKNSDIDIKRLERFLRSEWFQVLTDLDGTYLIRKIKEVF